MVQIGIKLNIDFLDDPVCQSLYGEQNILQFLCKSGVRVIESPIDLWADDHVISQHVHRCLEAGLCVSYHPYTEGTENNAAFFANEKGNLCREMHERILGFARDTARAQQAVTVVNIHAAAASCENSRDELLCRSVEFFKWVLEWCHDHAPMVRPVVELQIRPYRGESTQRIGDNYAELLEITKRSGVGACWDFGHAFMNTRNFGGPLYPPDELLSKIVHVHCHDVAESDHHPLVYGNVPWKSFLGSLLKVGFDDKVIIEVQPEQFISAGGLPVVTESIRAIKEFGKK